MEPLNKSKGARTKEVILKTAMELFLEKGYSATSTNEICASANVNKQTLYYHVKNKRNLFAMLHTRSIENILLPFLESASSIKDPCERFVFMIKEFTKLICKHPELRVLIHETLSIKDIYFKKTRKSWKRHYSMLRDTIMQLQSNGKAFMGLNPSWVAMLLLGQMTWITFWFDYRQRDRIDEIADTSLRMILANNPNIILEK